ncbi:MAG TPA: choice-of-anchor Q domain-containing protein [Thermomicrobiaceae bacterium]|nr:choice-of-anchor Q domain-containing protein [Thermomicrobiaceae bacterium]
MEAMSRRSLFRLGQVPLALALLALTLATFSIAQAAPAPIADGAVAALLQALSAPSALGRPNVIDLAANGTYTLSGPEQALVVSHNVELDGHGATFLAGNGTNCGFTQLAFALGGHNLASDDTCDVGATVGDPMLDPAGPADHGGPTMTIALQPGSPAVAAGNDRLCGRAPVAGVDQRGVDRLQGDHCDLGAFELEASQ